MSLPDSAVVMEAMRRPVVSAFACNHTLNNLIGWLATHLMPWGSLAWRCNAVSAIYGAVAVGLFHALARRLGASRPLAALAAASLMVSHGVWWHGTVVENYALSAVLLLACARILVDWPSTGKAAPLRVFLLFFLAGLAVLNHLQNGLLLVGCAWALLGRACRPGRPVRGWPWAVVGGLLGLAPYLGVAAWEAASGRAGDDWLAWFLGGGGFGRLMFCYNAGDTLPSLARHLVWNHPGPFLLAAVGGFIWTFTVSACGQRRLWRLVQIVAGGNLVFFLGYATWDRFSFLLAPFTALAVAAAGGLAALERRCGPRARRGLLAVLALGVIAAPFFYTWQTSRVTMAGRESWLTRGFGQVAADYGGRYDLAGMLLDPIRRDRGTIDLFVRQALATLPPGAVWVDDGSTYFQIEWLRRNERLRRDISVEMIASPLLPGYGTAAQPLAMLRHWRGGEVRWFVVFNQGSAAEFIAALRPFGWEAVAFPVAPGRYVYEMVR